MNNRSKGPFKLSMKIARFYHNNRIHTGIVQGKDIISIYDYDGDLSLFRLKIKQSKPVSEIPIPIENIRFAPPVSRPSKIIAIGLNYHDHAKESKGKAPDQPLIFAKFPNSLVGQHDLICWDPGLTKKVDFEAELAVIIGQKVHNCPSEKAMEAILGYTCANDVSARDLQFGDKQWVRGKSLDTFCPVGPWIVTADEIHDPHNLKIFCRINGNLMQDSNTSQMIFKVPYLISFLSRHFTLLPGDIILTGTPKGVGAFRTPSVYLRDGDEVAVEIEDIGILTNHCKEKMIVY